MHKLSFFLLCLLSVLFVSCGSTAPELTQTASGTWLSPKVQGEKQQILTATTIQEGEGALDVSILDVTTRFLPEGELLLRPDESGMQIIRLFVRVANIGTTNLAFSHNAFALGLKNGTAGRLSFFINTDNASDFLQSQMLAPGQSVEGALYFELPETATREEMLLEYRGADRTTALPLIR